MKMALASFALLFMFLPGFAQPAVPASEQVQVTFYSHKITMLGGLPGHEHAAFKGKIYDEDRELAFMEPDHFVTFNFDPGPHVFSATWWTSKHANSGAHVTLDLAAGQHYFIETFVLNTNFSGAAKLYIKDVTCEGAQQEGVSTKPLGPVHLRPGGVPLAVHEISFPQCP